MPEIGTSGSMSGERRRGDGSQSEPQATAPLLDSTSATDAAAQQNVGDQGHFEHRQPQAKTS